MRALRGLELLWVAWFCLSFNFLDSWSLEASSNKVNRKMNKETSRAFGKRVKTGKHGKPARQKHRGQMRRAMINFMLAVSGLTIWCWDRHGALLGGLYSNTARQTEFAWNPSTCITSRFRFQTWMWNVDWMWIECGKKIVTYSNQKFLPVSAGFCLSMSWILGPGNLRFASPLQGATGGSRKSDCRCTVVMRYTRWVSYTILHNPAYP